ncbi:MAG: tripartite tricarboxylate transporter substrate binding protein [Desulfovibrionaceae bacterium]|jgi:tripartite-type tricarboxylate transporter receptor subunit TctC|nr:tripartite tricarboxylate transporter substrate binding protein [Desulfovibrionaceae bacterium]
MKKLLLALCLVLGLSASAQAFPDRPLNLIVPFNAGGSLDSMCRIIAEFMAQDLGKPVMVVNRPGASGTIGFAAFLKMPNDGYNVLALPTSTIISPVFQDRPPLDPSKIKALGGFLESGRILFSRADAPFKTFEEFLAYAGKNPGKLKFGSGGDTPTAYVFRHILAKEKLDVNVTLFNGGAPAAAAIMGGHVDLVEGGIGSPADVAATAGKLNRLCLLTGNNLANLPELKTPLQMGYDYATSVIFSLFLHADAPDEVQNILTDSLKRVLANKDLLKKFASRNLSPRYYGNEEITHSFAAGGHVGELYNILGKL